MLRHFPPLLAVTILACGAPFPAHAQQCGGLNQQACKANEGARACTGRLVNQGGRCQILRTQPRKDPRPPLEPHPRIDKAPPIQPQLCDPSALKSKGGRC